MSQIQLRSLIDMDAIDAPPSGYIIGYDLDGELKQKNQYGTVSAIFDIDLSGYALLNGGAAFNGNFLVTGTSILLGTISNYIQLASGNADLVTNTFNLNLGTFSITSNTNALRVNPNEVLLQTDYGNNYSQISSDGNIVSCNGNFLWVKSDSVYLKGPVYLSNQLNLANSLYTSGKITATSNGSNINIFANSGGQLNLLSENYIYLSSQGSIFLTSTSSFDIYVPTSTITIAGTTSILKSNGPARVEVNTSGSVNIGDVTGFSNSTTLKINDSSKSITSYSSNIIMKNPFSGASFSLLSSGSYLNLTGTNSFNITGLTTSNTGIAGSIWNNQGVLNIGSSFSYLRYTEVNISSASLLDIDNNNISLLTTLGTGSYYDLDRIIFEFSKGTASYTWTNDYFIINAPSGSQTYFDINLITSGQTGAIIIKDFNSEMPTGEEFTTNRRINVNGTNSDISIYSFNGTAPTVGNGTIKAKIWYYIRTFG